MNFLHLSDLHLGNSEDAFNWCGQLVEDLRYGLDCERLDAVVISGDVANKSEPEEYAAAGVFFETLQREYGIRPDHIVIVPGNHDLNWGLSRKSYELKWKDDYGGRPDAENVIVKEDQIAVRNDDGYGKRFGHFSKFHEKLTGRPYPLNPEDQGILYHFPDHNVLILGLNSSWRLDHHFKSRAEICGTAITRAIAEILKQPEYENCMKFAVWHHPLSSEAEDRIKDSSFMQRLANAGINVVFHGHIHKSENSLYRYNNKNVEIVSTGTFGAPSHDWVPGYPLQYNYIRLEGNTMTVETRRREEIGGAWKPDARWLQGPGKDPLPRYSFVFGGVRREEETKSNTAGRKDTPDTIRIALMTHENSPTPENFQPEFDFDWSSSPPGDIFSNENWTDSVRKQFLDVRKALMKKGRVNLEIFTKAHIQAGFAFGYIFRRETGFSLNIRHFDQVWRTHIEKHPTSHLKCDLEGNAGSKHLAVSISIAFDAGNALNAFLKDNDIFRCFLNCAPTAGQPPYHIPDGETAAEMAGEIRRAIQDARQRYGVTEIHLFAAIPIALAYLIGWRLNQCGNIHLYHHDKSSSLYTPSWIIEANSC